MRLLLLSVGIGLFVNAAVGLLRFPCAQLVIERVDPLVTPGKDSVHVHQITGGNAFNMTMHPDNDLSALSTCTTCRFKQDNSNYWTNTLYYRAPNGSYFRVPQMRNPYVGNPIGGQMVYYVHIADGPVKAFPKGFRMTVGDPYARTSKSKSPNDLHTRAITYRCFGEDYGSDPDWQHPGTGPLDTVGLPPGRCAGGIRAQIFFPQCWNGVDLDTLDHMSHMAYAQGDMPRDGMFWFKGTCPASHPVRVPAMLYEIVWDTRQFNANWDPATTKQPFVLSNGDPTGYSLHGDYIFGWQGDSLQRAMDTCTNLGGDPQGCKVLNTQTDVQINSCTKSSVIDEKVDGDWLASLPGCNPIQTGPTATPVKDCRAIPRPTSDVPVVPAPIPLIERPPVPKFHQCGGQGWTGAVLCQAPSTCTVFNEWYSQCL